MADKSSKNEAPIQVLKALSNPIRLGVVFRLAQSPTGLSWTELSAPIHLSQPAISHHLAKLVGAGIISESKAHTTKYYVLNQEFLTRCGINIDKLLS